MTPAAEAQLIIEDVHLSFGGLKALSGVSTAVRRGEIVATVGPNGAGKTCLLNCINRFYHPERGRILFEGRDITRLRAHQMAALGIARTFQNVELFAHMTVLDNIKLGGHVHLSSGLFSSGIYYGKTHREEMALRKEIEEKIIDLSLASSVYGLQNRASSPFKNGGRLMVPTRPNPTCSWSLMFSPSGNVLSQAWMGQEEAFFRKVSLEIV